MQNKEKDKNLEELIEAVKEKRSKVPNMWLYS
jgi:hypothetical protein